MSWTCRKKIWSIEQFLSELRPFEICISMVKYEFFFNNSKNIDIWILRKKQNLFRNEFYMCVQNLVKIDWEMAAKNPRWPPRNFFFTFQHLTAEISRALLRSPCYYYCYHCNYISPGITLITKAIPTGYIRKDLHLFILNVPSQSHI